MLALSGRFFVAKMLSLFREELQRYFGGPRDVCCVIFMYSTPQMKGVCLGIVDCAGMVSWRP